MPENISLGRYPQVATEEATLKAVLEGRSLARYGDGELKLMKGRKCVSQAALPELAQELQDVLRRPSVALVGIPALNPQSPKYELWSGMSDQWVPFLSPGKGYYSAFVSRPDSAPWAGTREFFDGIESLWRGQRVTFVGNGVRSLTPRFLRDTGAEEVDFVECAYSSAYTQIDALEKAVLATPNHRVLLCAGATATCLAERLARQGRHAVDLGHIGMFWRRYGQFGTWVEQREINVTTGAVEPNP